MTYENQTPDAGRNPEMQCAAPPGAQFRKGGEIADVNPQACLDSNLDGEGSTAEETQGHVDIEEQLGRLCANYRAIKEGKQTPYVLKGLEFLEGPSAMPKADEWRAANPPSKKVLSQAEDQALRYVKYIQAIKKNDGAEYVPVSLGDEVILYLKPDEINEQILGYQREARYLVTMIGVLGGYIGGIRKILDSPHYTVINDPKQRVNDEITMLILHGVLTGFSEREMKVLEIIRRYTASLESLRDTLHRARRDIRNEFELFRKKYPASVDPNKVEKLFYAVQGYKHFERMVRSADRYGDEVDLSPLY